MDNKIKTPPIKHIQKKYMTHEDSQYNTALFIHPICILICLVQGVMTSQDAGI